MSVVGFCITVTVSLIVSLATNGFADNRKLPPHLLTPYVRSLWYSADELEADKKLQHNHSHNNNNNNQTANAKEIVHELSERNKTLLS